MGQVRSVGLLVHSAYSFFIFSDGLSELTGNEVVVAGKNGEIHGKMEKSRVRYQNLPGTKAGISLDHRNSHEMDIQYAVQSV